MLIRECPNRLPIEKVFLSLPAFSVDCDYCICVLQDAFYNGEWSQMNARDRGNLMYRLGKVSFSEEVDSK